MPLSGVTSQDAVAAVVLRTRRRGVRIGRGPQVVELPQARRGVHADRHEADLGRECDRGLGVPLMRGRAVRRADRGDRLVPSVSVSLDAAFADRTTPRRALSQPSHRLGLEGCYGRDEPIEAVEQERVLDSVETRAASGGGPFSCGPQFGKAGENRIGVLEQPTRHRLVILRSELEQRDRGGLGAFQAHEVRESVVLRTRVLGTRRGMRGLARLPYGEGESE